MMFFFFFFFQAEDGIRDFHVTGVQTCALPIFGGEAVLEGDLSIVALANGWITISVGGGPTDDKPAVTLEPPSNFDRISGFLNIRVADIAAVYKEWSARGAKFLTPPINRGNEIRCYMRDPHGHLIEVGQLVMWPEP